VTTVQQDPDLIAELIALRADVASLRAEQAQAREESLLYRGRRFWPIRVAVSMQTDPQVQYKIHIGAMWFWMATTVLVTVVFFGDSSLWARVAVFYLVLISQYACWATDFDGASSSLAAIHAREARARAEESAELAREEAAARRLRDL
jgi:hypothetical protein